MLLNDLAILLGLLFVAFAPAVAALVWLRSLERGRKERWSDLTLTFLFGAIVAVVVATVLELAASYLLSQPVVREYALFARDPTVLTFISVIVIAPLVEEFAKLLGVRRFSGRISRPRNGLMLGAAVGLGFSATENFLYEGAALLNLGLTAFIATALVRSFASGLMHASATSISGYGVGREKVYGDRLWPYYLAAVGMHAFFNLFASFGALFRPSLGPLAELLGLLFSLALVIGSVIFLRWRLRGYSP